MPAPLDMEALMRSFYREQEEGEGRGGCPETARLLVYADASDEKDKELERHVAQCPSCQGDLVRYRSAEGRWEAPVAGQPSCLREWFGRRVVQAWAVTAVLGLVVLGLVGLWPREQPDTMRFLAKGSFSLKVAAERNGKAFRVEPQTRLTNGDQLGFFYSSETEGHLMIFFVGEAGELTRLHPADQAASRPIAAGQNQRIPDGAILSPSQGCEWIAAVRSQRPFAEADAAAQITKMFEYRAGCELPALDDAGQLDVQTVVIRR